MALTVLSRVQVADGLNVDVTLSGAPTGTLQFAASKLPQNQSAPIVSYTSLGGNVYRVQVRDGTTNVATPVQVPYYIRPNDLGGTGPVAETCEWVCLGSNADYLRQLEILLVDLLEDNKAALERRIQIHLQSIAWPDGQPVHVHKIHAGSPGHATNALYPRVSIRAVGIGDDFYFGVPRSDYDDLSAVITAYYYYQTEVNWEPVCRALGMGIFTLINQTHYLEMKLDATLSDAQALWISQCQVARGDSEDVWDEEYGMWCTRFTAPFGAKMFLGRDAV